MPPLFSVISFYASLLPLSKTPPRLTAIVKSVSSLNVGAIGTGFKTPPSINMLSLYLTGVRNKGSEMDKFWSGLEF